MTDEWEEESIIYKDAVRVLLLLVLPFEIGYWLIWGIVQGIKKSVKVVKDCIGMWKAN